MAVAAILCGAEGKPSPPGGRAQTTLTAQLAAALPARWRLGAAPTSGAMWRPPMATGRRHQAAASKAFPGCTSAFGCASPARLTGLTVVASTACRRPCRRASPLATPEHHVQVGQPNIAGYPGTGFVWHTCARLRA